MSIGLTLTCSFVVGNVIECKTTVAGFAFELNSIGGIDTNRHLGVDPFGLDRIEFACSDAPDESLCLQATSTAATITGR